MSDTEIAAAVLECVGGRKNVLDNSLCATRLRISVRDPQLVNRDALNAIRGVLGIATRGDTRIEVVFGPNMVKKVYESFVWLTQPSRHIDSGHGVRHSSNMHVQITPDTPGRPVSTFDAARPAESEDSESEDDETAALLDLLFEEEEQEEQSTRGADEGASSDSDQVAAGPDLLVINGPNVNMYGRRTADSFDDEGFPNLLSLCHAAARDAGFARCDCFQSNHEGEIVDRIQDAYFQGIDAIVINAGGYAQTSRAIADALRIVGVPAVEVRLLHEMGDADNPPSCLGDVCVATIDDVGIEGYRLAIETLARRIGCR